MSVGDNFDPDLIYEVVWNGGELLPPRPEKTSSSWATNEERRSYTQTGNHRKLHSYNETTTLPSIGEDQDQPEPLPRENHFEDMMDELLDIEKALKNGGKG